MNSTTNTMPKEAAAWLPIVKAIADAIRALKSVRSGDFYAHLMGRLELDTYENIINILIRAKVVRRDPGHMLVWTGAE